MCPYECVRATIGEQISKLKDSKEKKLIGEIGFEELCSATENAWIVQKKI